MADKVEQVEKKVSTVPHGPKVFVYGTLKQGHGNHRLLRGATLLGRSYVEGPWRLHDLGAFPAVVQAEATARVFGEVYLVDSDILGRLDILEGYPSFYTRTKVPTQFSKAWMYHINPDSVERYANVPVIEGGVWRPSPSEREWARGLTNTGG